MKIWMGVACLCVVLVVSTLARADPVRIVVAASHARGADGEAPLRYSTEDADHVQGVMLALGGATPATTIRLVDPTAAQLDAALDRAREIAARHAPSDVSLLFYFSGHGDRDRIHLGSESVAVADLVDRARAVPAALRLVVIDACRSDPTRPKGITTEPAFALAGQGAAAQGVVVLSASESGEAAQESDQLRGAVFTHYWVSGLRGAADANGDGRVTLAESYDFAYSQTLLRSARGSGVLQHPTASFALTEFSPIVLTQTFGQATRIEFPQGADALYVVYALGSRSVLGEIWSSPERRAVLAVPAGRYVVTRRGGGGDAAAAELSLARGDDRVLSPGDFRAVPEERLASKGGRIVLHPDELSIELGAGASRIADALATAGVRFAYVFDDEWAVAFEPRAALGVQHTAASNVGVTSVGLEATIERRWRLGTPVLAVGAGAAADLVWQRVERVDAARVAEAGYPTATTYEALAPGPVAVARLRVPLGTTTWVEAAVRAELLFADFGATLGADWVVTGGLNAGVSF